MMNNKNLKVLVSFGLLVVTIIAVMVLGSSMTGFGAKGFDEPAILQQFWFYVASGMSFLVGIIILFVIEFAITKDDNKYGSSIAFSTPEDEVTPIKKIKALNSWPRLILLSFIFICILSLWNIMSLHQTTFTGIGVLTQQFTPVASLVYSSALIPAAENLGAAFLFGLLFVLLRRFARKTQMDPVLFIILSIFLAIIVFLAFGLINHQLRYSGQEIALTTVAIFWALGGLITALSGSFVPFWILHIGNNLIYALSRLSSVDAVKGWIIGFGILCIILYVLTFVLNNKKRGN